MRRIIRGRLPFDIFSATSQISRRPQSICRACERQGTTGLRSTGAAATFTTSARRAESGFDDKMRNALWGGKEKARQDAVREQELDSDPQSAESKTSVQSKDDQVVTESEQQIFDPHYSPASTWDGLEWIGGEKWLKEIQDEHIPYQGFFNGATSLSQRDAIIAVSKAVRELEILEKIGLPLTTSSKQSIADVLAVVTGPEPYPNTAEFEERLKNLLSGKLEAEDLEPLQATETDASVEAPTIDLSDAKYKFAIVKRVMQISGVRIPDPELNRASTTQDLVHTLTIKPKPKKLVETLKTKTELTELPNVKIASRRVTSLDKEKEVGRWKVIEKELMARGLPVIRSRH